MHRTQSLVIFNSINTTPNFAPLHSVELVIELAPQLPSKPILTTPFDPANQNYHNKTPNAPETFLTSGTQWRRVTAAEREFKARILPCHRRVQATPKFTGYKEDLAAKGVKLYLYQLGVVT